MPQIAILKKLISLTAVALVALSACTKVNPNSDLGTLGENGTPKHADGWLPYGHRYSAQNDIGSCTRCHGTDYQGGAASVSCTKCHIGDYSSVHPASWSGQSVFKQHADYVKTNGKDSCANIYCHGADYVGVAKSGPSCTKCHIGGVDSFHPAEWGTSVLAKHKDYVSLNTTSSCANGKCHGNNLEGVAGSGPSCTSCHAGGLSSAHPAGIVDPKAVNHSAYATTNGTTTCANANCHGADLKGVTGSGPSCTSCHLGTATSKHPASFGTTPATIDLNHSSFVASNGVAGCQNAYCHGSDLAGYKSSANSAAVRSCLTCHKKAAPTAPANCTSCHDKPPATGAHATHIGLPTSAISCSTCHSGAGSGTSNHNTGTVIVQIDSTYNAKSGTAAYDKSNGVCSSVSCHGGQTTPSAWNYATINLTTDCATCHSLGTSQFNSYSSGQHSFHATNSSSCANLCHDVTKLGTTSNHFKYLNTSTLEGPANATIKSSVNYNGTTCSPGTGCHATNTTRTW